MADAGVAGDGQPPPPLIGPDRAGSQPQQRSCLSTDGMTPAAMEAGVSAVSALTEPGGPEPTPTPAQPQREASHHSIWSAAASSVFSFWPTAYVTDQRTGRRVSILRKLFQEKERRSRRQRLMLSCVCLLLYLGVAVWAYGYGLERFGTIRALYFAVMTLTTIGFGDVVPSSQSSRLFTVFFALAGICIVGVGLGELVGHLIEQNNKQMDSLKEAISRKIVDAIQRRRQKDAQRQELAEAAQQLAEADAANAGFSMLAVAEGSIDEVVEAGGGGGGDGGRQQERPLPRLVGSTAGPSLISASTVGLDGLGGSTVVEEAEAEAEAEEEGSRGHGGWSELALVVVKALVPVVVINLVGAVIVGFIEHWSAIDVLYWAVMSATTIGYGDIHPDKQGAYLVALCYLPLAVVAVAQAINTIAAFILHQREERRQRSEVLKLVGSWEMLGSMDRDQDGEVSLGDFMGYLLRLWGLVDDQTLRLIEARYAELDVEGVGILRREDFNGRRRGRSGNGRQCESCLAAASSQQPLSR